ncbi:hypothetical protein JTE90_006493 [Oedothorax gibbosus]|uniref:Uncharacterized protein n=1 Tax=Oedothorax gibbosus TaxID=931172 RepID=A0AAV6VQ03_9ARAC|nr:hypothetical protein JTE90_006493 [Oedothorax gibbosus]
MHHRNYSKNYRNLCVKWALMIHPIPLLNIHPRSSSAFSREQQPYLAFHRNEHYQNTHFLLESSFDGVSDFEDAEEMRTGLGEPVFLISLR